MRPKDENTLFHFQNVFHFDCLGVLKTMIFKNVMIIGHIYFWEIIGTLLFFHYFHVKNFISIFRIFIFPFGNKMEFPGIKNRSVQSDVFFSMLFGKLLKKISFWTRNNCPFGLYWKKVSQKGLFLNFGISIFHGVKLYIMQNISNTGLHL